MKKFGLVLSVSLGLFSSNAMAGFHGGGGYHGHYGGGYHGCYSHGSSWWPAFGFGLGVGALLSYPWYHSEYYYPSYGYYYSYPAYTYSYAPPTYTAPQPAMPPVATVRDAPKVQETSPAPEPPAWEPSYAGTGQWVPDPEPYSFTPGVNAKRTEATATSGQTVTVSKRAGGVPVYRIEPSTRQ